MLKTDDDVPDKYILFEYDFICNLWTTKAIHWSPHCENNVVPGDFCGGGGVGGGAGFFIFVKKTTEVGRVWLRVRVRVTLTLTLALTQSTEVMDQNSGYR